MAYSTSSRLAGSASRVLAIIGFLALIIIGMYGSVRVAQAVPGVFSQMAAAVVSITSIFIPADEIISVTVPSLTLQHESPVTVAFEHRNKSADGQYAFRYSCVNGVSMSVATGGSTIPLTCNTSFTFEPFNNSITVVPSATAARFTDVEVFVVFTPESGTPIIGSTLMTIENTSYTEVAVTPTPATPTKPATPAPRPQERTTIVVPQGRASDPNGYTDLTARVIEVGNLDATGAFVASTTPDRRSRIAVRFAIENVGTKTSKEFTFSAVLPTFPPYTYFSPSQVALGPGDRIEYTIGFDSFIQNVSSAEFIVNVDPTGGINERNKENNIIKYAVTVK